MAQDGVRGTVHVLQSQVFRISSQIDKVVSRVAAQEMPDEQVNIYYASLRRDNRSRANFRRDLPLFVCLIGFRIKCPAIHVFCNENKSTTLL